MTPGGTITEKDIIEKEAYAFGGKLVTEFKKVIKIQEEANKSVIEYGKNLKELRKVDTNAQFLSEKQKEILAFNNAKNAIELNKKELIGLEKAIQESIRTDKLKLQAEIQKQNATKKSIQLTIEEKVQNEIANRQAKQDIVARLNLTEAYQKLSRERVEAKNKLRELILVEGENSKATKQAAKDYELLDSKIRKADKAVGDFTKNVGNYPFSKIGGGIKDLIGAFGITAGVGAAVAIFKDGYETIKKFEQGIADLSAITGATGKDLDYLKNQAIDLGKNVKGGAIAVVESYKLIASAKPELLENVKDLNEVTKAVLTLSKASGQDLPSSATALTDALNQFNAPASESGKFINALANGAKYGAAEIPQVTDALLKFGSVARSSNINIKESTALVELLAENGLKGADAGTALRNVLLKLSAPDALPKKAQEAIKSLGISFEFLKDKSIPIQEKLEKLKPILKDNAKLVNVFGLENTVAAQNIIGHTDRLKELTGKMGEYGTAQEQADIRSNTLEGDTDKLLSTYDSFILSIGKGSGVITDFFRFFTQGATGSLNALIRLNSSWDELYKKAIEDGKENGKKLFDERFNSLIGDKISDEQRKRIRQRIKEINDEIAKGNFSDALKNEKINLQNTIGKSTDELSVSLSVAKAAYTEAKIYESQLVEVNKKIKANSAFGTIGRNGSTRLSRVGLQAEKEQIIRDLAEQNAIIDENNKKRADARLNNIKGIQGDEATQVTPSDKENKDALAKQKKYIEDYLKLLKQRNDDEFALNQFRLERSIYYNQLILDDESKSVEDRISAYSNIESFKKQSADNVLKHEIDNLYLSKIEQEKSQIELNSKGTTISKSRIDAIVSQGKAEAEQILKTGKLKENATNAEKLIFEKYLLDIKKLNDKAEEDKQKIIDSQVSKIEKEIEKEKLAKNTAMNQLIAIENDTFAKQVENAKGKYNLIEKAEKDHQKRIEKIKKDAEKAELQIIIDDIQKFLDADAKKEKSAKISTEERRKLENKLGKAKADINALDVKNTLDDEKTKAEIVKEYNDKRKQLTQELYSTLKDLAGTLFNAKIQNIDDEISKSDEYYDGEIKKAGSDARKKDALEKEKEKKRKELEKKKQEEQVKQAVFNKVLALAEIALNTARAVSAVATTGGGTYYADFGVSAATLTALTIAMGVAQAAVVLATPLPKYKGGRKSGPEELAVINDGGVTEIITSETGANPRTAIGKNAIVKLGKNDIVHKSIADYERFINDSILSSFHSQNERVNAYQEVIFNNSHSKEGIDIAKKTLKAIENIKQNVIVNLPENNLEHAIWAMSNKKW